MLAGLEDPRVSELAGALLDEARALYGVPNGTDDPLYGNLRAYLTDMTRHDFRIREMSQLLPRAFLEAPRRILDLGCGPGIFAFRLLGLGHDAYGIDLDAGKIALAHAHVRAQAFSPAWCDRLTTADAGEMPFESGSFDLVASYHVVEHVADLRSVLYEAVRVTKPGGYVHIQAPDYRYSYDTHYCMPWPRMMPAAQARAWCAAMGRPFGGIDTIYRVTAPEVAAIVEALGCRIVASVLREHRDNHVLAHDGTIPADPIVFRSDFDLRAIAAELRRLDAESRLPKIYRTCLEFTILAQRR